MSRRSGPSGEFHMRLKPADARMRAAGETGSVVTLICDGGARYAGTYYSDEWVAAQGWDLAPHRERLERFLATGDWVE